MTASNTFIITVNAAVGNTELEQAAQSLSPGGQTTLTDTGNWLDNDAGGTGGTYTAAYGIQWDNRFFYDHARKKAVGIGMSEGASPYWVYVYDAATRTWTNWRWSLTNELGHPYESIGYDPASGYMYLGVWFSQSVKRVNAYSSPPAWQKPFGQDCPVDPSGDVQTALAWHPNLYGSGAGGIVMQTGHQSANGRLYAQRASTGNWEQVPGVSWSGTDQSGAAGSGAVVYNAADDTVWCATGEPGNALFRLTAGSGGALGTATQIGSTPIHCGFDRSSTPVRGVLLPDPAGSANMYILEKSGSNRVWKWNGSSFGSAKGYQHPFPDGFGTNSRLWIVASAAPLGVFICKGGGSGNTSPIRVWKPND